MPLPSSPHWAPTSTMAGMRSPAFVSGAGRADGAGGVRQRGYPERLERPAGRGARPRCRAGTGCGRRRSSISMATRRRTRAQADPEVARDRLVLEAGRQHGQQPVVALVVERRVRHRQPALPRVVEDRAEGLDQHRRPDRHHVLGHDAPLGAGQHQLVAEDGEGVRHLLQQPLLLADVGPVPDPDLVLDAGRRAGTTSGRACAAPGPERPGPAIHRTRASSRPGAVAVDLITCRIGPVVDRIGLLVGRDDLVARHEVEGHDVAAPSGGRLWCSLARSAMTAWTSSSSRRRSSSRADSCSISRPIATRGDSGTNAPAAVLGDQTGRHQARRTPRGRGCGSSPGPRRASRGRRRRSRRIRR